MPFQHIAVQGNSRERESNQAQPVYLKSLFQLCPSYSPTLFSISSAAAPRKHMCALPNRLFLGPGSTQLSQLAALLPFSGHPPRRQEDAEIHRSEARCARSILPSAPGSGRCFVSCFGPAPASPAVPAPPQLSAGFPGSDPALFLATFLHSVKTLTYRLPGPAPPPPGQTAPPPVLSSSSAFSLDSTLPGHHLGRLYNSRSCKCLSQAAIKNSPWPLH
ncbi:hypothetical protein WMY93_021949 [Mugilogobius chulae]|uniref:Uncharacterized protein n=1 Tax=Mugilogobius chulae TaxID=88201 RepID=A0AAW0NGR3_9GOBI